MTTAPMTRTPSADLAASTEMREGDVATRVAGAVALAELALIHVQDLPDTYTASRLIGVEYIALIAASMAIAAVLLTRRVGPRIWLAAGALAGSAMVAYILSRTTGIPGDSFDIGNWRCTLGLGALSVEVMIVALAGWAMTRSRGAGPRTSRAVGRANAAPPNEGSAATSPRYEPDAVAHRVQVRWEP